MHRLRHPSPRRRVLTIACLAMALLVRLLVPAGWMPVADAAGLRLALCDGTTMTMPGAAMPGMAMPHGEKAPMQGSATEHPCAFAGPTAAPDVPTIAAAAPIALPTPAPHPVRRLVSIGRGLAAPPPPPTGPPAFV